MIYSNLQKKNCQYLPDNYDFRTQNPDFEAYLLHTIEWQRILHRKERGEYVPLQATILQSVCHDYRRHIDRLLADGIIEIYKDDGKEAYTPTEISKRYRLSSAFKDITFRRHFPKKQQPYKESVLKTPIHKTLYRHLCTLEALDHKGEFSLMAIQDKKFFMTPCDYNRLHTNLTNLDSSLKRHLTIGGKRLVQFDIINSQPFFLALLLCNTTSIFSKEEHISKTLQNIFSINTSIHNVSKNNTIEPVSSGFSKNLFIQDCCSGKLYDRLAEKLFLDRKTIKRQIYSSVFFGKHKTTWEAFTLETRIRDLFQQWYPEVWTEIGKIKKKDYRHLAHALQRLEAKTIIHTICPAISKLEKKASILTIHDSIVTTEDYADSVEEILADQLKRLVIQPRYKREAL